MLWFLLATLTLIVLESEQAWRPSWSTPGKSEQLPLAVRWPDQPPVPSPGQTLWGGTSWKWRGGTKIKWTFAYENWSLYLVRHPICAILTILCSCLNKERPIGPAAFLSLLCLRPTTAWKIYLQLWMLPDNHDFAKRDKQKVKFLHKNCLI